jgi:hypothetical protein
MRSDGDCSQCPGMKPSKNAPNLGSFEISEFMTVTYAPPQIFPYRCTFP